MPKILTPRKQTPPQLWDPRAIEVYCLFEDKEHYHAYAGTQGHWIRKAFPKSEWKLAAWQDKEAQHE